MVLLNSCRTYIIKTPHGDGRHGAAVSCGRTRLEKKERCMIIYLLKRIAGAAVVLWAIITITFGLMHAIPGGPFTQEKKLPPAVMETSKPDTI